MADQIPFRGLVYFGAPVTQCAILKLIPVLFRDELAGL